MSIRPNPLSPSARTVEGKVNSKIGSNKKSLILENFSDQPESHLLIKGRQHIFPCEQTKTIHETSIMGSAHLYLFLFIGCISYSFALTTPCDYIQVGYGNNFTQSGSDCQDFLEPVTINVTNCWASLTGLLDVMIGLIIFDNT